MLSVLLVSPVATPVQVLAAELSTFVPRMIVTLGGAAAHAAPRREPSCAPRRRCRRELFRGELRTACASSVGLRSVSWMRPSSRARTRISACFGVISSVTARTTTGSFLSWLEV